ncbi:MAG: hypothetical protein OJF62_003011 [Pseudolabrys sp.]|jgi:outer membrane immunogenic protein|nr:hypothetical protein [Pseudolabrys sp.]
MRRVGLAIILLSVAVGSASAADIPVKAPVTPAPVVAPIYNWSGFYVGGHVGAAWSNAHISDPTGVNFAPPGASIGDDGSGILGGAQIGVNWQIQRWVLGIQGDFAWTGIDASVTDPFLPAMTLSYKTEWIGMLTGRVGYAWDNWLLYLKGGAAWVHNKYSAVDPAFLRVGVNATGADTRVGWTLGGGFEYGFTPHWSAFVEYDYIGLGTHTVTLTATAGSLPADVKQNINIVKVGINYRFGGL